MYTLATEKNPAIVDYLQHVLVEQVKKERPLSKADVNLLSFWKSLEKKPRSSQSESWPILQDFQAVESLRMAVLQSTNRLDMLRDCIKRYLLHHLKGGEALDTLSRRILDAFINTWQQRPDPDRQMLSFCVAQRYQSYPQELSFDQYLERLDQIPTIPNTLVRPLFQYMASDLIHVVKFAKFLSDNSCLLEIKAWYHSLNTLMSSHNDPLLIATLVNLPLPEWTLLISNIHHIYDKPGVSPNRIKSSLVDGSLHSWTNKISGFFPVIVRLEQNGLPRSITQYFLRLPPNEKVSLALLGILRILEVHSTSSKYFGLMKLVLRSETPNGLEPDARSSFLSKDAQKMHHFFSRLLDTMPYGFELCSTLMNIHEESYAPVVSQAWTEDSEITSRDKKAIVSMRSMLGFEPATCEGPAALPAAKLLENEVDGLIQDAKGVDRYRRLTALHDSKGVTNLLRQIGIKELTRVEAAFATLPWDLFNVVKLVSESQIQLHLSLAHLRDLQRHVLGLKSTRTIFVHLFFQEAGRPPAFCIHTDDEPSADIDLHLPYSKGGTLAPHTYTRRTCRGQDNPATYQLALLLSRHLNIYSTIKTIFTVLSDALKDLAKHCISCARPHPAYTRRLTPCRNAACFKSWDLVGQDVCLPELTSDPGVVDLLLGAFYHANKAHIIDAPKDIKGGVTMQERNVIENIKLLDPCPSDGNPYIIPRALRKQGLDVLGKICNSYRGFVASVNSGPLRIPAFPEARQFVVANTSPDLEARFNFHLKTRRSAEPHVYFHGTSLSRLYPILYEGLRVLSGTALQQYGATYGHGIYLSSSPWTAWSYAPVHTGSLWPNSSMQNFRVVLGVESAVAVRPIQSLNSLIYVANDATTLAVRYIFLIPLGTTVPAERHVQPAMKSAFRSLRSRAV
ncbi:MAG: hypothetical protein M1814_001383 [Vezdaea aestivalis]|nr:MAG: hypothetical protein M1814_001383 [Vezdaea aestivalis]